MTKTTRLWYVPLADVVEAAGRAALLAAEFVDAKMLTPVAAAKLLRKEVKPGDVLALMDGTQLRALARVLVLGSRVTVYRNPRLPQRAHGARNDEGAYRLPRVKRRSGKVGGDAGFGGLGGGHEQRRHSYVSLRVRSASGDQGRRGRQGPRWSWRTHRR